MAQTRRAADVHDMAQDSIKELKDYVEIRLNLIADKMTAAETSHKEGIKELAETMRLTAGAAKTATDAASIAMDLRYQQRFEAQSDALAAAFLSQQTAMQTALAAAKEAVVAALAAADRAVAKAEAAADKRFEALNELRSMLQDIVNTMMTRIEGDQRFKVVTDKVEDANAKIVALGARLDTTKGEKTGASESTMNTRQLLTIGISFVLLMMALITLFMRFK
ncbi:MAG: hypothetical protein ACHQX3_00210 [Nitrospirales bacterium]|jgi:hypothetical protein